MSYSFKSTCSIRQSRRITAILAGLLSLLILFCGAGKCRAAISVGEKPPGMSDEQFYQIRQEAAAKDLDRKYAVGQRRYDQRMAYRQSVINGLRSQLEDRRKMIEVVPAPVATPVEQNKVDFLGYAMWTLAIAVMLLAGWQYYRSRQPGTLAGA